MKTRKRTIALILCGAVLFLGAAGAAAGIQKTVAAERSEQKFTLNGEPFKFENMSLLYAGCNYAPLRELCEKIGVTVNWDRKTKTVELLSDRVIEDKPVYRPVPATTESYPLSENLSKGVVPDEETAREIGRIILEKATGQKMEYTDGDFKYFLYVTYNPYGMYWSVEQDATYKGELVRIIFDGDGTDNYGLTLYQNTGEVGVINTVSNLDKSVELIKKKIEKQ